MSYRGEFPPSQHGVYDANRDPLDRAYGLEYFGKLKTLKSSEIANSMVSIGMECLDRDTYDPSKLYDLVEESGCKFARLQTGWIKCEKEKGVYDFAWLEDIVDNLLQRGVQPWFSASYGNPLYTPVKEWDEYLKPYKDANKQAPNGKKRGYTGEVPLYHGQQGIDGWCDYLKALATRFENRVKHIEIWNEPNCVGGFWLDHGAAPYPELEPFERNKRCAKDYCEFVKISAKAIRSVVPSIKIVAGALSNATSIFTRVLGEERVCDIADAFSFHNYGTTPEKYSLEKRDYIKAHIFKGGRLKELWQGEAGRSTLLAHHTGTFAATEYNQAKFIARRTLTDFSNGLDLTSAFIVSDLKAYFEDGSDQSFGLFTAEPVKPKLAAFAFQSMCTLLAGLELARDAYLTVTPPDGNMNVSELNYNMTRIIARRKGHPVIIAYLPENANFSTAPITCEIFCQCDLGYKLENPVAIDSIRQNVWRIAPELIRYSGGAKDGFFIGPFPLVDYPLIITDLAALDGVIQEK